MLRKLIGNIRRQPKRTRDNVALGVASTVTFVVALVWVFNAPTMFSGLTGVGETAKKEGGFLDTISEQTAAVKDAFSSESAATESIKELIKEAQEISLSKKECEILQIFVANPNQIIKREELTKKVWEDHGVFVGRSLDTYISKLRKKLKADSSIKLKNIHGVGYKMEIKN